MQGTLEGKCILVTGAAVRIGRAIAVRLAEAGACVVVHCRDSVDAANELVAELGGAASGHRLVRRDLGEPEACESLIAELHREGPLWGLVNNASRYSRCPLAEVDAARLQEDFLLNAFVPVRLMTEFRRRCRAGCIVNLLDERVDRVDPAAGSYGLAKKTLRDATEAAALEWAPEIRVNGIAPGYVLPPPGVARSAMATLENSVPMKCRTLPEEIAEACRFLMSSPTVTGEILHADGGLHLAGGGSPERARATYGRR